MSNSGSYVSKSKIVLHVCKVHLFQLYKIVSQLISAYCFVCKLYVAFNYVRTYVSVCVFSVFRIVNETSSEASMAQINYLLYNTNSWLSALQVYRGWIKQPYNCSKQSVCFTSLDELAQFCLDQKISEKKVPLRWTSTNVCRRFRRCFPLQFDKY